MRTRLTTKPGVSWQRIGCFPSFSPNAYAVSNAVSELSSARTISTSGISGAGLKKCMPTMRSGVDVAEAISVTESADVFVASTASGRQMRSSSAKSSCLGPSSSTIASMTRSQSARSASSVVVVSSARSNDSSLPLLHLARQKVPNAVARKLAEICRNFATDRVEARLDAELRDARSHRTESDDTHLHARDPNRGPSTTMTAPATASNPSAALRPTPRATKPIVGPLSKPPV